MILANKSTLMYMRFNLFSFFNFRKILHDKKVTMTTDLIKT